MLKLYAVLLYTIIAGTDGFAATLAKGFDVNDVTVLFPLDANDQPVPSMVLDDDLISERIFSALMLEATNQWISAAPGSAILKREDWKLMGFRYDPCAPADSRLELTCIQELRLVAQSMGRFGPSDSSLHLIC